jgi:transposase
MTDEFKEDARDGDGDGFVQDGTEWERPVEEVIAEEEIVEEPVIEEPVVEKKKAAPKKTTKKVASVDVGEDKVALWSESNLHHLNWGAIAKGPNIVSKELADKWTGHKSIRLATPEEVADFYKG